MPPPCYPIALVLDEKPCLVVGGGEIADGKLDALLLSGASVTVVSPEVRPRIAALAAEGQITLHQRPYVASDIAGMALVIVIAGDWIADPLWETWGATLAERGMGRAQFGEIVAEYGNELRLWVAGERPWDQCVSGLAGRVTRRLPPTASASERDQRAPWQTALHRVSATPDDAMPSLISRIGELHLLFDVAGAESQNGSAPGPNSAFAIVWAGARPRDPEVPFGEGRSGTASSALAEALGRFLLKDPAYPPFVVAG